ncbi:hypothetical protein [uncultured Shewanella sp.]|uniref:hypothetical protein n=1 Tax=uncultured Shewanella sp. TaxID=173975 RepID=UPI0026324D66|nr:hypothetical protein [uncultured Shewanella sp.]
MEKVNMGFLTMVFLREEFDIFNIMAIRPFLLLINCFVLLLSIDILCCFFNENSGIKLIFSDRMSSMASLSG